jgi:hypothetical protein
MLGCCEQLFLPVFSSGSALLFKLWTMNAVFCFSQIYLIVFVGEIVPVSCIFMMQLALSMYLCHSIPLLRSLLLLGEVQSFGPSGVRALPLAAGINIGGMAFFLSFSLSLFLPVRC